MTWKAGQALRRRIAAASPRVARFLGDEQGSYIIFMAMLLPAMVAMAGLASEGGFWLYRHQVVQSAADNAAYSVATALAINSDSTAADLLLQAKAIAANDYGLVHGAGGVTVTLNNPPVGTCYPSSKYIGNKSAFELVINQAISPLFSKMWSASDTNICSNAVAILSGGGQCVLATGKTGTVISANTNNLDMNLTGCGIFSNSSDAASIAINGNNINVESIGTVGGVRITGNLKTTVSVTTGNPPIQDPYAVAAASWPTTQQTAPTVPTAPATPPTLATASYGSGGSTQNCNSGASLTLAAGTYRTVNINSRCTRVTLSGGTYNFTAGLSIPSGVPVTISGPVVLMVSGAGLSISSSLTFPAGTNSVYVQTGGWTSGAVTFGTGNTTVSVAGGWTSSGAIAFGAGNNSVYVTGGSWTNSGAVSFGASGTNNVSVTGGNWTDGSTSFGGSNLTAIVKVSGVTGGALNLGTVATTGSGTFNITADGAWTISSTTTLGAGNYLIKTGGDWTIGATTTFGAGAYDVTVGGDLTMNTVPTFGNGNYRIKVAGDWLVAGNVTFGSGNYDVTVGGGWTFNSNATLGAGNYTFALGADLTLNGNFTAGSGVYSGSMRDLHINGTTTVIGRGIYYISGNMTITKSGGSVTANNVTFVLTGNSSALDFSANNATLTITPPTTGWSAGISIWEPNSTGENSFGGNNATSNITGVIYVPKSEIEFNGNSGANNCIQIIAKTIEFEGRSISFNGNCAAAHPGMKTFGQIIALVQ